VVAGRPALPPPAFVPHRIYGRNGPRRGTPNAGSSQPTDDCRRVENEESASSGDEPLQELWRQATRRMLESPPRPDAGNLQSVRPPPACMRGKRQERGVIEAGECHQRISRLCGCSTAPAASGGVAAASLQQASVTGQQRYQKRHRGKARQYACGVYKPLPSVRYHPHAQRREACCCRRRSPATPANRP